MILTDGKKRKEENILPIKVFMTESVIRPPRKKTRGKEKVEEECCDCDIQLDSEFTEGTNEAFMFYENPTNHPEFCFYRILCKA